ncbi:hypothetical protein SAMN05216212_1850 [Microbulbifer yueqingensis]|uniref:Uncharacterized protein n=1 Tax=Microbulbifer yueqingensis TaxID=658219 RepID=A0A1G9A630_9GAMM|nr:hypothetical protein SAMN05216212_1850 [Microbulbifer yueqingensis]
MESTRHFQLSVIPRLSWSFSRIDRGPVGDTRFPLRALLCPLGALKTTIAQLVPR